MGFLEEINSMRNRKKMVSKLFGTTQRYVEAINYAK